MNALPSPTSIPARATRSWRHSGLALLTASLLVTGSPARATNSTLTITADPTTTDDSYVVEDNAGQNNGGTHDLHIKSTVDNKNRNIVIRIPLSGLSGRTVLQAWLDLKQSTGNAVPLDARIYPLTESFNQAYVSWADRDRNTLLVIQTPVPWNTPGGTHASLWSDRQLITSASNNTSVQFQVGPIVEAWNSGLLPNDGFIIEPTRGSPAREVVFDSSDQSGTGHRPSLIIRYTDQPPAIAFGTAEIQPQSLHLGAKAIPLTAWLNVDALSTTPSGTPTGFDALVLTHAGGLAVTGVDSLRVGGTSYPATAVTWTDDGNAATFRLPRVASRGTVKLSFRADVLAPASANGLDLPISVDDSTTPGAGVQSLFAGNADGTAGNGDDWVLGIVSTPPVAIDLKPDIASIRNHTCLPLACSMRDAQGNTFSLPLDSVVVRPPSAGAVDTSLVFCATTGGPALLIACYGALRDTSRIDVAPDRLPAITSLTLRDGAGNAVTSLTPIDTMFADVRLMDGDGSRDVQQVQIDVLHAAASGVAGAAAFGASFQWNRGGTPPWILIAPTGTSWQVVSSQCAFDSTSFGSDSAFARLAFTVGRSARASASGAWSIRARVTSVTPPSTADSSLAGLNVPVRWSLTLGETTGDFGTGAPGTSRLPLGNPSDGRLHLKLDANTAVQCEARASDLVGKSNPLDTLHVDAAHGRLHESPTSSYEDGAALDTAWVSLETLPPPDDESATTPSTSLWIDLPLTLSEQGYVGSLVFRLRNSVDATTLDGGAVTLEANVVSTGLAAQLALAEVNPHAVVAGAPAQALTVDLLPLPDPGDTGVDRIRVGIPPGYGTPTVDAVTVAGASASYRDVSKPGTAEALLDSKVTSRQLIELTLHLDAPVDLDPGGAAFVVGYDDQSTAITAQSAVEGDANGVADGNDWKVRVVPGPLARLVVTPRDAAVTLGRDTTFFATGFDALGHPLPVTPAWRAEGGVGTVGSNSGAFLATATGNGLVIATSGSLADTGFVVVAPPPGLWIRSVQGPASVVQGERSAAFTVRIDNTAAGAVTLDTLRLAFGRATMGDGDADFTVTTTSPPPLVLSPGAVTVLSLSVDVALDAAAAPLSVQAMASGVEAGTGVRHRDTAADSALALDVRPGGVTLSATQSATAVRPGATSALMLSLDVANQYPDPHTLERLTLANLTSGPGGQDALDDELGQIALYRDDGDGVFDARRDTLVQQSAAFNGAVTFTPIAVWLAPSATTRLFVVSSLPVSMRDGDVLDLALPSVADVVVSPTVSFRNAWPVGAPGGFVVDGMTAAEIAVAVVGPSTVNPGAHDRLAFEALLPANGYATDMLTRLAVSNEGSARPDDDIQRLRAWIDDGDSLFATSTDHLLGTLAYTGGGRWQLTGLQQPVPAGGIRLFVSADLTTTAQENATIQLSLPASPDFGVGMSSGNSGPVDVAVTNPSLLSVSDADRVALAATTVPGGTARPGDRNRVLSSVTVTNTYTIPRTLTTLAFDDATTGSGGTAELDGETRLLTVRLDGDDDGDLDASDPVLGTGFFQSGRATFTGLAVSLDPGRTRRLFLTADLSSSGARDGDQIGARLTDANSVDFAEATAVAAAWPLDSGARWTVDGFIAAQVTNLGAPGATVGPGDGPLPALDIVVPRNGYASDLLRGVRVVNLGTARASDLSQVQLWRDGGDGAFGGDDVLLGPLTPTGTEWTSPLLSSPVTGPGTRLFVSVSIAAAAAETTTVRLAIPENGIEYESTDDGPVDAAIANPEAILISSSPLLATLSLPRASTVGQTVAVKMVVRNASAETVRNVSVPSLDLTGTATLGYVSGPQPATFDLAPAASDTILWSYVANGAGDVRCSTGAGGTGDPSGLPRNAPRVTSNTHRVFIAAQQLDLTAIQTMPIRVNRGQVGVVPFSLTLAHPGGADASDVRVDRIRIRLEQESGAPIVPASLLDTVEVNEGTNVYLTRNALEASGSEIDLPLATPVTVTSEQPATISLRLDLDPATTVPTFRVVLDDSTWVSAVDATSAAPVRVHLAGAAFPLRSELASVVAHATEIDVASLPPDTVRTSRGRPGAELMRFRLVSPGLTGISSNVRVTSLAVAVTDSSGADRTHPGDTFGALRIQSGAQVLASRALAATDSDSIAFTFTPPIELGANVPMDLALVGDVTAVAPFGRSGARLLDSTRVEARDVDSRAAVPAHYDAAVVRGGVVVIEAPADTLRAGGHPSMPATVVIGESDVPAIAATLRHPGAPATARLRVDGLTLQCLDDLRRPVVPRSVLGRVAVAWNGVTVADLTSVPNAGDRVAIPLPGLLLEPGDTARVEVRFDVDAAAATGFLELVVPLGELTVRDANTLAPAVLAAEPGSSLPLASGLGRLASPARDLAVGMTSLMPATLAGDGRAVATARLTLRNADPEGAGPIDVDHLVLEGGDRAYAPAPIGAIATRVEAWVGDTRWAQSGVLTRDSVTAFLSAPQRLTIAPGATTTLELRMITRASGLAAGVRLGIDRAGVGVAQPASALLAIGVGPEGGQAFPLWTESGVMSSTDLAASYVNYPNPFAAGREATTVAYYMPSPGRVTLRVLTARGEPVATLLDGAARAAGQQQGDRWDGRNGNGGVVVNGVYVAELEIRFDDGQVRTLRRKLAVVR